MSSPAPTPPAPGHYPVGGGAGSAGGFRGACSPANLPQFVANIAALARTRGHDGVDLDWEPLEPTDAALYTSPSTGCGRRWTRARRARS